jgi:hypothetical protein
VATPLSDTNIGTNILTINKNGNLNRIQEGAKIAYQKKERRTCVRRSI